LRFCQSGRSIVLKLDSEAQNELSAGNIGASGTISRRTILLSAVVAALPRSAFAQNAPHLFVLPAGITSPLLNVNPSAPKREWSLRGWLACNNAQADRLLYAELFVAIGERSGPGDGVRTFNVPSFPFEMKGTDIVRGVAICPSERYGTPAGTLMPFDVSSNT
jgi:hypothetical protein